MKGKIESSLSSRIYHSFLFDLEFPIVESVDRIINQEHYHRCQTFDFKFFLQVLPDKHQKLIFAIAPFPAKEFTTHQNLLVPLTDVEATVVVNIKDPMFIPDNPEWLYDITKLVRLGMNIIQFTFPTLPESPNVFCTGVIANLSLIKFKPEAERKPSLQITFEDLAFEGDWSLNDGMYQS